MARSEVIEPTGDSEGCTIWYGTRTLNDYDFWDFFVLTDADFHFANYRSQEDYLKALKKIRRGADPWKVFSSGGSSVALAEIARIERETTEDGYLRIQHDNGKLRWAAMSSSSKIRKDIFSALRDHFGDDMDFDRQRERPMRAGTLPLAVTIITLFFTLLIYLGANAVDPPPPADGGPRWVNRSSEGMKSIGRFLGGPLTLAIGGAISLGTLAWMAIAISRRPTIPVLERRRRKKSGKRRARDPDDDEDEEED